ncbi:MAG: hypothetical protein AMXMBFR64_32030 [Myxococcales bacterium]
MAWFRGRAAGVRAATLGCVASLLLALPGAAFAAGPVMEGMLDDGAYEALRSSGRLQKVPGGTGFVYLEVTPATATIKVANKRFDSSPVMAEGVATGYQRVEVKAGSGATLVGWVLVEPMKVSKARVFVPTEPGNLTIIPDPPGADVYLDGQLVGQAPMTLERLAPGKHDVLLKSGDMTWTGSVDIAGGTEVLRARLIRGNVRVATPEPARPVAPVVAVAPPVVAPPVVAPPVVAPPVVAPPVVDSAPPTRPASPSGSPAPGGRAVDLRSLSPSLRAMAWQNLQGKSVEVQLATGVSASVEVGAVQGNNVVLKVGGEGRLVPMEHIVSVTE